MADEKNTEKPNVAEKEEKKGSCGKCYPLGEKVCCYLGLTVLGLVLCILSVFHIFPLYVLVIGACICAPQPFLMRRVDEDEELRAITRDADEKAAAATFKAAVFLMAMSSLVLYIAKAYTPATVLLSSVCILLVLYWISYLLIKSGHGKEKKEETAKKES